MLDSDNDGFISAENCDLEQLPTEALELLSPLFEEMEVLGVQCNMDGWVEHALEFV